MEPRKNEKREPKRVHPQEQKPKLRIVKLEPRIAPALTSNHNETLVRQPAKTKPKVAEVRQEEQKPRLRIVKLEQRIDPRILAQHNETMVRDRSARVR